MNKKAFEFSFTWIFSITVGAIILFLAIFAATQLIGTGEFETNTKTAVQLRNVLDPLGTTLESGKSADIVFVKPTRVFFSCNAEIGDFGENRIQISESSSFGDRWSEPGGDISTVSQYIFAEDVIEGQVMYFFIFPFNLPYKIADLMMPFSKEYCFIDAPGNIRREVEDLSNDMPIVVGNDLGDCSEDSVTVCFGVSGCDITVRGSCNSNECENIFDAGTVIKDDEILPYVGNLMYGAIFASRENYDCNVERLMRKTAYVSEIYGEKAKFIAGRCDTGLQNDNILLSQLAEGYNGLNDLQLLYSQALNIEDKNEGITCTLF